MTLTKVERDKGTHFVIKHEGVPVGYLWRNKGDRNTTFPWQVKKYTGTMPCPGTGRTCYTGELVTSVYPEGKGLAASNTAKRACLSAL